MNTLALGDASAELVARGRSRSASLHFTRYETLLVLFFALSLPLSNPWVRGDGVGYYAFARSLLFEHRLDFTEDWQRANSTFREGRIDAAGHIRADQYTVTGHLDNHFSVGPAILWSPFLLTASLGMHIYNALGGHAANDGYSPAYLIPIALGTALYGFLAVWLSFRIARKYVSENWAFLAAVGMWFGSSLPVYMYFNPSWSHAHSAFTVALFLWYWDHTRGARSAFQWLILGAFGGLMADVYYPNAILFVFPALESFTVYREALGKRLSAPVFSLLFNNAIFLLSAFVVFLPTLITKKIIYGGFLRTGYYVSWDLSSPAFFKVCFSSDHGLFSWTPLILLSLVGLIGLYRNEQILSVYSVVAFTGYIYFLGCYSDWDGLASFGNRFCISLTPLFVLGLAVLLEKIASFWKEKNVFAPAAFLLALLVLWNFGLIFQWGVHLIPARGPISWRKAAYNQVAVVPKEAASTVRNYLTHRKAMMHDIEEEDVRTLKSTQETE